MAKRRFNAKKIANTPSLKRNMARFCAEYDVKYTKPDYVDLMYKGNRGYISMSEDDLGKEFDKKLIDLKEKFAPLKKEEDSATKPKWWKPGREYEEMSRLCDEGESIAAEIFEEVFLK